MIKFAKNITVINLISIFISFCILFGTLDSCNPDWSYLFCFVIFVFLPSLSGSKSVFVFSFSAYCLVLFLSLFFLGGPLKFYENREQEWKIEEVGGKCSFINKSSIIPSIVNLQDDIVQIRNRKKEINDIQLSDSIFYPTTEHKNKILKHEKIEGMENFFVTDVNKTSCILFENGFQNGYKPMKIEKFSNMTEENISFKKCFINDDKQYILYERYILK